MNACSGFEVEMLPGLGLKAEGIDPKQSRNPQIPQHETRRVDMGRTAQVKPLATSVLDGYNAAVSEGLCYERTDVSGCR